MKPKITIGIPAFNAGQYIGLAIQSVLGQSFNDFELIITDDGSTDNTVEVINSFNDPRIRLITDSCNHGISYRLNQQIELSNGDFFVRMDADDIMLPFRLRQQYDFLIEHPEVDAIGGSCYVLNEFSKIIGYRKGTKERTRITQEKCLDDVIFIHPTVMGKLSYFKKYKYSEMYTGVEDFDLWFRSAKESNLMILPDPVIMYRDPLKFKISTYLSRLRKQRKRLKLQDIRQLVGIKKYYIKLIVNYLKAGMVFCSSRIGLDKIIIKRRNISVKNDEVLLWENYIDKLKSKLPTIS